MSPPIPPGIPLGITSSLCRTGGSNCITYFAKRRMRKGADPASHCAAVATRLHLFYQHKTKESQANQATIYFVGAVFVLAMPLPKMR